MKVAKTITVKLKWKLAGKYLSGRSCFTGNAKWDSKKFSNLVSVKLDNICIASGTISEKVLCSKYVRV